MLRKAQSIEEVILTKRLLLVLLSALVVLGAACGGGDEEGGGSDAGGDSQSDSSDAPAGGEGLTITGVDYAFETPATAPAGETEITFENGGKEEHELIMVALKENAPDVSELIKQPQKEAEKFFAGEPTGTEGPIAPGETKTFTADLQPGTYAMVCFVESKTEKQPHAFLGMVNQLTVQ